MEARLTKPNYHMEHTLDRNRYQVFGSRFRAGALMPRAMWPRVQILNIITCSRDRRNLRISHGSTTPSC